MFLPRTSDFHARANNGPGIFCCKLYGNAVYKAMHTVVETPTYLATAAKAGMTEAERVAAILIIAKNPAAGAMIAGGGGARKVRVPRQGKGKSGGYRVITYYIEEDEPVFLLSVLSKSKQANLSDAHKQEVKKVAKEIRNAR